jgi:hypothetical protein
MNGQADNEAFARLIVAIEPWLGEVVIIGGWATDFTAFTRALKRSNIRR